MEEQHPHAISSEAQHLGMDELSFFVQMVKFRMQGEPLGIQGRFWKTIKKHCPHLVDAIEASFTGEYAHITFTRSITSAAFSTDEDRIPENEQEEGRTPTE